MVIDFTMIYRGWVDVATLFVFFFFFRNPLSYLLSYEKKNVYIKVTTRLKYLEIETNRYFFYQLPTTTSSSSQLTTHLAKYTTKPPTEQALSPSSCFQVNNHD